MMLGSKGILPPLIPDCFALRAPAILGNIHNPLIFLRKMVAYSCFWRVPRSKILLQVSLHRISNLLTPVSRKSVNERSSNHMKRQIAALSLAAVSAVTAVAMPMEAEASTNFELRKKVIGISGIMGITDVYSNVTRAQFAEMRGST